MELQVEAIKKMKMEKGHVATKFEIRGWQILGFEEKMDRTSTTQCSTLTTNNTKLLD
jgi:hypothetical protein